MSSIKARPLVRSSRQAGFVAALSTRLAGEDVRIRAHMIAAIVMGAAAVATLVDPQSWSDKEQTEFADRLAFTIQALVNG